MSGSAQKARPGEDEPPDAGAAFAALPVKPAELPVFSRLLEEARDLGAGELEHWLAALEPAHQPLAPQLRRMLAELASPSHPSFLAGGPRLAGPLGEAATLQAGELVGPYRLLRLLGRGGMSAVWLAERPDGIVKRSVALKMPLLTLTSTLDVERFERERDLLAMLAHPQIARLYDAGVAARGQPFIVLEYVDGLPITEACDARQLDIRARLQLFLGVLAAVDHAHKHLVVHRDIKPSNVFVGHDGEVKLLDFGVAKLLDEPLAAAGPSLLTRDAGCALTPRYAAPEQLDRRPISTATDVYSLGLLLYELLTGTLPHADRQGSVVEAVEATLHGQAELPSRAPMSSAAAAQRQLQSLDGLRHVLGGDLDTIVLKAIGNDPADRYRSCESFAADLRCYLEHRPIAARPPSLWRRSALFVRRHRAVTAAAVLGLMTAATFAGAAYYQHLAGLEERARADAVRDFMFDLVNDAEADELHADQEPTGRQMVAGAVKRARAGFATQPRLRGELLAELGRMQLQLGDASQSAALLHEALGLLETYAPSGDAALNKARAHLAAHALRNGDLDEAAALAQTAVSQCTSGRECAKARQYADTTLGNLELRRGNAQNALVYMRQALRDNEEGFGQGHPEGAAVSLALAVVSRQAGELVAAQEALARGQSLARGMTLRSSDRVMFDRMQALLNLDLGHYAQARSQFRELTQRKASQRMVAQQWRLLATSALALGDVAEATAAAATSMALTADASGGIESLMARQAHARSSSLKGESTAEAELAAVIEGLQKLRYAESSMEILRARRFLAETRLRASDLAGGLGQLQVLAPLQAKAQKGQEIEFAQTLDLLGVALRLGGRGGEAAPWHEQAGQLLAAKLPAEHPLRLRHEVYVSLAAWQAAPLERAGWDRFARDAGTYAALFPADSTWKSILNRCLRGAGGSDATPSACAGLVL